MTLYLGELPIHTNTTSMMEFYTELMRLGVTTVSLPIGSIDEALIEILRECGAVKYVENTVLATDRVFEPEACIPRIDKYNAALRVVESLGLEPIALVPSFLDLAAQIVYEGSKLIEIPNRASTFIHFLKNVIEELVRVGVKKVVIRDRTVSRIFSGTRPLYGYTRDFVLEAYDYLAYGVKEPAVYIPNPTAYSVEMFTEVTELKAVGLRLTHPETVRSVLTDYVIEKFRGRDKKILAGIVSPNMYFEESSVRRTYMELLSIVPRTKVLKAIDGIDLTQYCFEFESCISRILEAAKVLSFLET